MEGPQEIKSLIKAYVKEMRDESILYAARLQILDKRLSALYHYIEQVEVTHVSQSHKIFKVLQEVLRERREVKYNLAISQSFNSNIKKTVDQMGKYHDQIKKKTFKENFTKGLVD